MGYNKFSGTIEALGKLTNLTRLYVGAGLECMLPTDVGSSWMFSLHRFIEASAFGSDRKQRDVAEILLVYTQFAHVAHNPRSGTRHTTSSLEASRASASSRS